MNAINAAIKQSIAVKQRILENESLLGTLDKVIGLSIEAFQKGNKVLLCGNGGSAADAQHIAAELSGRFYRDRDPLYAEALHVNSSYLTAVANDYSYEEIYVRMVKGMGRPGDVLIGLSTSGNSKNVIRAMEEGRKQKMVTVAMTGHSGGKMKDHCDHLLNVPSADTPRIQESHILLGHILCERVERVLFPKA